MLDIHTFANLERNPSLTDISLELLQEYYDHYLLNNTYEYHLTNGQVIPLPFLKKDLCHLLGIKKIIEKSLHVSQHYKFSGCQGYENIKNGDINFQYLKRTGGKSRFKDSKDKWVFFFLLHRIAEAPHNNIFVKYKPKSERNKVKVEFLVYDICDNAVGHLGVNYDSDKDVWFPQTYMIERITENDKGMALIEDRDTIAVEKIVKK